MIKFSILCHVYVILRYLNLKTVCEMNCSPTKISLWLSPEYLPVVLWLAPNSIHTPSNRFKMLNTGIVGINLNLNEKD